VKLVETLDTRRGPVSIPLVMGGLHTFERVETAGPGTEGKALRLE
jgi:hypothetical protein